MKKVIFALFLIPSLLISSSSEIDLKAVFIGKFTSFITWTNNSNKDKFVISVIDNNPFDNRLNELYSGKTIQNRPVEIKYFSSTDDFEVLKGSDILFITITNQKKVKEITDFAKANSILTVSDMEGFAERGGIIQIDFVMQKVKLKINNSASKNANIKISASLLNISEVIEEKK